MHLFKVTITCYKEWMEHRIFNLKWGVIADTPDGALEQILDEYDLSGVKIVKSKAEIVPNGIVVLNENA